MPSSTIDGSLGRAADRAPLHAALAQGRCGSISTVPTSDRKRSVCQQQRKVKERFEEATIRQQIILATACPQLLRERTDMAAAVFGKEVLVAIRTVSLSAAIPRADTFAALHSSRIGRRILDFPSTW